MAAGRARIGRPAPEFKGTALMPSGEFQELQLCDYRGKYLVLFFYPMDFTHICPVEITAFSDLRDSYRKLNCKVIAASVDSNKCHEAWTNTNPEEGGLGKVEIPLLSDPTHTISEDYGVLLWEKGVSFRGLFIIDDKGILRQITINDFAVPRCAHETLRLVKNFQRADKCKRDVLFTRSAALPKRPSSRTKGTYDSGDVRGSSPNRRVCCEAMSLPNLHSFRVQSDNTLHVQRVATTAAVPAEEVMPGTSVVTFNLQSTSCSPPYPSHSSNESFEDTPDRQEE